jgi:hypothetical protein
MRTLAALLPYTGKHRAPKTAPVVAPDPRVTDAEAWLRMGDAVDRQDAATWEVVADAANALSGALEAHRLIECGDIHWDAVWPHLRDEADPYAAAVEKAAEEVASAAGVLGSAMSAHCGVKGKTSTGSAAS